MVVTRFAPSPTGYLHLGHAYSALLAYQFAMERQGRFLLRIEDIDQTRCRPEFTAAIFEDLAWLGLCWEQDICHQSAHLARYQNKLDFLHQQNLLYPCFCTRRDIAAEIARSPGAPHGPEGPAYPGICKQLTQDAIQEKMTAGISFAWRLHMDRALDALTANTSLAWQESDRGLRKARPEIFGDVVLARKEMPTSYHLSVTIDDAFQGVTDVIRGEDLFQATDVHVLLQALLHLSTPVYHHHKLIAGPDGKRFSKRDGAVTLRALRSAGKTAADIRAMIGLA